MIFPEQSILVNDKYHIKWKDRGNKMPALLNNYHAIVYNDLPGPNEIQTRDPVTLDMAGNFPLNSPSDAVGDTTVQGLLDWGTLREQEIDIAMLHESEAQREAEVAHQEAGNPENTFVWEKTWIDYDPNYS